jgi:hypothetical protein
LQPLVESRQQQLVKLMEQLSLQEAIMGGRITLGLRLSGQISRDVTDLHAALARLRAIDNRLYKFAAEVYLLGQLLHRHHELREAKYALPIARLEEKVRDAGNVLLERLKDIPYPLDRRYNSLKAYLETELEKPAAAAARSAVLARAQRLLDGVQGAHEKLNLLAAEYATIAEEAYQIERIRLVGTE